MDTVILTSTVYYAMKHPTRKREPRCEELENAAKALHGEDVGDGFYGMVFQDSDAAKWIEAAAYSLALYPDDKLSATVDELIDKIAAAQTRTAILIHISR